MVWDIALPQYINNVAFVADIYIKNKKTLDHDIYKTKIQAVNNAGQGRLNSVSTEDVYKRQGHGCPKCDTAFFPKAFLEQPFVPCGVRTSVHDTSCEEEQAGNDME